MNNMTTYSDELNIFARAIIANDMGGDLLEKHRHMFGLCIKNILPVDTVSYPHQCIFFSQLIETRGDIGKKIYKKCCSCFSAEAQDQAIFSASAASGTGKTHGVYAAGKYLLSLVLRVGSSSDEINGGAELSSPWDELVKIIKNIVVHYNRQYNVDNVMDLPLEMSKECAHFAYMCIKMLVCCYVAVSIDALRTSPSLTPSQQRELILRFHRNGRSEDLVRDRFISELELNRNQNTTECYLLLPEKMESFFTGLKESIELSTHQILICFDEINALKDHFPSLFIHSDAYAENEESDPKDDNIHRGLLYAVACCMVALSKATKWAMLMTGTAFSLTQFSCSSQGLSPVRGCVETVSPEMMLDVPDMHALLQHYFTWRILPWSKCLTGAVVAPTFL
jgi:hypothetical protein